MLLGPVNGDEIKLSVVSSSNSKDEASLTVLDERIIFETSAITFSFHQFLWEFIVHIFYPLFCWYAPEAHLFGPLAQLSTLAILISHVSNILVYVMILAAYMSTYVLFNTWIVPYMFFVVHRMMIAVKYGCFSSSEYRYERISCILFDKFWFIV